MIHSTADVDPTAQIGDGTKIWHHAQVREGAIIGDNCTVGKGVYIDRQVKIGSNVKIQNGAQLFHGVSVEDGVFIGPGVILANDTYPRSVMPDGRLKVDSDWTQGILVVKEGASIGAGCIILPDLEVGSWSLIGAGSLVNKDVFPQALMVGTPAYQIGYVCRCAKKLTQRDNSWFCPDCNLDYQFNFIDLK